MPKFKSFAVAILLAFSATACSASGETQNLEQSLIPCDSIVQRAVGDSIFNIILNAKSITAEIVGYTDSTKTETPPVKLSKEDLYLFKFLMQNPLNVASNDTVFGRFMPNINFKFQYKNQICQLSFDFGLKKWRISDVQGNVLKSFDLGSPEVVHFASRLFPNDDYLNELLKP